MSPNAQQRSFIAARAPIAGWLNFNAEEDGDGVVYRLGFGETHIGNPVIRALHGGVISAFLEFAMQVDIAAEADTEWLPATVNFSVDFLTSSRAEDMVARVRILRRGRRLAFLEATGWQGNAERPVAVGRASLALTQK